MKINACIASRGHPSTEEDDALAEVATLGVLQALMTATCPANPGIEQEYNKRLNKMSEKRHIFWRIVSQSQSETTYETRYFPASRDASDCAKEVQSDGNKWMYGGIEKPE